MIRENSDQWLDEGDWRWDEEARSEQHELEDLTPLFANWREAFADVTSEVHDIFAWAIIGNPVFLGWQLKNKEIPEEVWGRAFMAMEQMMLSIPYLHEPEEPVGNGYFMWWEEYVEWISSKELADCAFDILHRLANHPDGRVQVCALHGLGHLDHDGKRLFFENLLRREDLDPDQRKWFEECRDGTLM